MKHVLSALFLVVFGLAISASAEDAEFMSASAEDVEMTPAELEVLERALSESELQPAAITDEDFDDDDFEDDDDDEPSTRGWNPISWIKKKAKNKCVCENNICDCCFKMDFFKSKACLSAELLPTEQKISISFKLDDKSLVEKKFTLNGSTSVCGDVPVPGLTFMKFCFTQQSSVEESGTISSCSNIEFKVGGTTGAILQFKCLELKDGKITVGGHKEVEKSAMFKIKAKNPFKGLFK